MPATDRTTTSAPLLLSVAEAAPRLGVTPKTVYRLVWRGELPHTRVGGLVKIRAADVAAYLAPSRAWTPRGRGRRATP